MENTRAQILFFLRNDYDLHPYTQSINKGNLQLKIAKKEL
jgi:hypothetical protein